MAKIDWVLVGFVKRSKNRQRVLKLLEKPMMPSEVSKEIKVSLTHASKIIRELNKKKLIHCLNEKLKIGRIYQITNLGKKILVK